MLLYRFGLLVQSVPNLNAYIFRLPEILNTFPADNVHTTYWVAIPSMWLTVKVLIRKCRFYWLDTDNNKTLSSGVLGSGLCVFSKWVIQDVFFHQWPLNGYIHKIHHGDWFGGKGVGLCRIKFEDKLINVYCTHVSIQLYILDLKYHTYSLCSMTEYFDLKN